MATLDSLPADMLEEIIQYFSRAKTRAMRRNLIALSLTCRRLYIATMRFRFQGICLNVDDEDSSRRDILWCKSRLLSRGCAGYVRRLTISGFMWWYNAGGEDNDERRQRYDIWKGEEVAQQQRQDEWMDEIAHDDSFWREYRKPIGLCPDKPAPLSDKEKTIEHDAWSPMVDFILSLPGLTDIFYQCPSQIPTCIIAALPQGPNRRIRLHMQSFSFRSLHYHRQQDVDAVEYLLATSPSLCTIYAQIYSNQTSPQGARSFNDEAILDMVSGLAPNLKSVSIVGEPVRISFPFQAFWMMEKPAWSGFFPSRDGEESQDGEDAVDRVGRGRLETIDIMSGASHFDLMAWIRRTDFNVLRCLHLRGGIKLDSLRPLAQLAQNDKLQSLQDLSLNVLWNGEAQEFWNAQGIATNEDGDATLANLLSALRPLRSLRLEGDILEQTWNAVQSTHGPTLQKLSLLHGRRALDHVPFKLSLAQIEGLVATCGHLTDLELAIQRSQGDEEEIRIYEALGKLQHLDCLHLLLSCAYTHLPTQGRIPQPSPGFIRGIFVNATIDSKLARDIFDRLHSTGVSPRVAKIEHYQQVIPPLSSRFYELDLIVDSMMSHWVGIRDVVDGGEELRIHDVRVAERGKAMEELRSMEVSSFHKEIIQDLWPEFKTTRIGEGEWRSLPLWREDPQVI